MYVEIAGRTEGGRDTRVDEPTDELRDGWVCTKEGLWPGVGGEGGGGGIQLSRSVGSPSVSEIGACTA